MKHPTKEHLPLLSELLQASGLPTDDLATLDLALFLIEEADGAVQAVGGVERCGDRGLLRSVATAKSKQGQGVATAMVGRLETLAMDSGLQELYLLTEAAEEYFERLGYDQCDRSLVPDAVRETRQFSSLCPASATVMRKFLS